jgi:hypothetical protein
MSLGNILNAAIGLILTFLLLGLLGATVHEVAASVLRSRARLLRAGLQRLLSNGAGSGPLFEKVFRHSLVQSLSAQGLPSYVPAASFSMALFDSLGEAGGDSSQGSRFSQIERGVEALRAGPTKQSLSAFIVESGGDLEVLRACVEAWFKDAMDRLSGIYKRRSQMIHLLFGLAVAVSFNVDSIHLARVLWQYPGSQQAIVSIAQNVAGGEQSLPAGGAANQTLRQLEPAPIPWGWESFSPPRTPALWLYPISGWLVTGLAVSLGAPFWFDLLQKVMNINVRGTGPKPDTA